MYMLNMFHKEFWAPSHTKLLIRIRTWVFVTQQVLPVFVHLLSCVSLLPALWITSIINSITKTIIASTIPELVQSRRHASQQEEYSAQPLRFAHLGPRISIYLFILFYLSKSKHLKGQSGAICLWVTNFSINSIRARRPCSMQVPLELAIFNIHSPKFESREWRSRR